MNLEELANNLGCSVKALTRKAEKLRLFRAKNNQISDSQKFCTYCNTFHSTSDFYKNRTKNSKLEYACKKYFKDLKLKNLNQSLGLHTTLLNQKRGKQANRGSYLSGEVVKVKKRPINPVVTIYNVSGKICNSCKEWKPLDLYGNDKKGIAGKRARCKDCYKKMYYNK